MACERAKERVLKSDAYWSSRQDQFRQYIESVRNVHPLFDVVVPVSGGKDSTTQVARMAEFDLRVLAVHVDYGIKTEIGRKNLENIARIGKTSLIVLRPPLKLHIKLIRMGLESYGDPDLFSHMLLHAFPIHMASLLKIPFILLGENSADIYGGDEMLTDDSGLSREWFRNFASIGKEMHELLNEFQLDQQNLRLYDLPNFDNVHYTETKMFFMSALWPWDSIINLEIAKKNGFQTSEYSTEGTFRNFVSLDEDINRVHQYIKLLKFGYGRSTDHANEEIRLGRIDRDVARDLILEHELKPLGRSLIDRVAQFLAWERDEICTVIEKYRNPLIWQRVNSSEDLFFIPGFLELNGIFPQMATGR